MALLRFWLDHAGEVTVLLRQHVWLVVLSTAAAVVAGIPAGVLAAKRPRLGRAVLAFANLAQTIPSLALLGFLLPLPVIGGVGPRTALVALFVYALLPIVRNTTTGLQQVDRAALEAADAVGMTPSERLRLVELPLALPSIVAGVRVATVIGVGTATIAAAVGAGGLGEYIFRGLSMVDPIMILAGAVPAAAIALAADLLVGWSARWLAPSRSDGGRWGRRRAGAAAAVVVIVAAAAWAVADRSAVPPLVVASKNTTEQVILGEIVAQLLEAEGEPNVVRKLNLGGTFVCDAGLRAGAIDVYIEYTGTIVSALFKQPVPGESAAALARARELYADRGVLVLDPLGFNNTFAMLVRGEEARRRGWRSIDDLRPFAAGLRPGFGHEFLERADGYRGFVAAYDLPFASQPLGMELSLIYQALADGTVDLVAGDATSALIERFDLVALSDTRHYFPPYDAVTVVRAAALPGRPALRRALARLAGRLPDATMRRLNAAVDVERQDVRRVASGFVASLP